MEKIIPVLDYLSAHVYAYIFVIIVSTLLVAVLIEIILHFALKKIIEHNNAYIDVETLTY
jgi:hypothetical protein